MTDRTAISSVTPSPNPSSGSEAAPLCEDAPNPGRAASHAPRWRVVIGWSLGPAAVYAFVSLLQALAEGHLTVDVGFGRSLAFWVGTTYLALILWGFLPAAPHGWYARPRALMTLSALGALGVAVCGGFLALWLADHWQASVGTPVLLALAVVLVAALGTLWLAGRADPPRQPAE
ncbi:MAG: hypothetical protein IT305_14435 [Chloroflexi bacterium]|nr:hypothetical protein [Chloroflexota bacterium]